MISLVSIVIICLINKGYSDNSTKKKELWSQEDIDYINSIQSSWVASKTWLTYLSEEEFAATLMPLLPEKPIREPIADDTNYSQIPSSFDSRVQWPNCVVPIRTQGACAATDAFSVAASLSYRLCINSPRYSGINLSAQYIINCDTAHCSKGTNTAAWQFATNSGTGVDTCVPYLGPSAGACSNQCTNGTPVTIYKASGGVNEFETAATIQNEIMANGPITSTITAYQDLAAYSGGIYVHKTGAVTGALNLLMLGWGTQNSTNYWICAASYGTGWGVQGFLLIQFGQCGIEVNGVSAMPLIQ